MAEIQQFMACEPPSDYSIENKRFFKLLDNDLTWEILEDDPDLFLLISYLVKIVRRTNHRNDGLMIGDCMVSELETPVKCGLTSKRYRNTLDRGISRGLLEVVFNPKDKKLQKRAIKRAIKSKIVNLRNGMIYDYNPDQVGDQKGDLRANKGRSEGDKQERIRTNKKEEEQQQAQDLSSSSLFSLQEIPSNEIPRIKTFEEPTIEPITQPKFKPRSIIPVPLRDPMTGKTIYHGADGVMTAEQAQQCEYKILEVYGVDLSKKNLSNERNITDTIRTNLESDTYVNKPTSKETQKINHSQANSMPRIYQCLDEINIDIIEKIKFTQEFSEDRIKHAIEWVKSRSKPRENLVGALRDCAKNLYPITLSFEQKQSKEKEDREKIFNENKKWATGIIAEMGLCSDDVRIFSDGYEEVILEGNRKHIERVPFSNKNFKIRFESYLRKKEIWIQSYV